MIEFALLSPVVAALLFGCAGVGMTFLRTLQADELCNQTVRMASDGADFEQDAVRDQIFNLYGGRALQDKQGALFVTHVMRDESGYRIAQSYEIGDRKRWQPGSPGEAVVLEAGEDAWVAELWLDNGAVLSSVTPGEIHAKAIR